MFTHRDPAATVRTWATGARLFAVTVLLGLLLVAGLAVAGPAHALTLIQNPGFEDAGLSNWIHFNNLPDTQVYFWRNTEWHHSGSYSLGILNKASTSNWYGDMHQDVSVEEGKTYTLGSWFVTDRNRDAVQMFLVFQSAGGSWLSTSSTNGSVWSAGADAWTHMTVTGMAPPGTTKATIILRLCGGTYTGPGGGSSNGCVVFDDVTIDEQIPVMDSISPSSGHVGQTVLINGAHFGALGRVSFGGIDAVVNSWSDSQISVLVPDWLNPGPITVTVQNYMGSAAYPLNFTVTESPPPVMGPTLSGLTPARGRVGVTVTLKGSSFGDRRGTSIVKFGARTATQFVSWSTTRIKVRVPRGTAKGIVQVTVKTPYGKSAARQFKRL